MVLRNKRQSAGRPVATLGLCVALLTAAAAGQGPDAAGKPPQSGQTVTLKTNHSTVLTAPWPVKRVAVSNPNVADVRALTATTVMVMARGIGRTDVTMWNDREETFYVNLDVVMDLEPVQRELAQFFPHSNLLVSQSEGTLVLRGSFVRAEHAEQLHKFLDSKKVRYVDMTTVAGVQQVRLDVRVAEVSRVAIRALGFNWGYSGSEFSLGNQIGPDGGGPLQPISVGSPTGFTGITNSGITVFATIPDWDLQVFLQALAENQYMRILAQPSLVALSGQEASFLAGGQIPVPVVQGGAGIGGTGATVTIEWKDFGVRLRFRPMVLGDNTIRMLVAPEVSELSQVGALEISGFRIPALNVRRAETTMELHSGQSFAMAGLLSRANSGRNTRIPAFGDVPVLGALFRSVRYTKSDTELVVLVTAWLVEPQNNAHAPPLPGELDTVPDDWELYAMGRLEGCSPPKLSPAQAAWVRRHGLDHLRGPGAWKSYECWRPACLRPASRTVEAEDQAPKPSSALPDSGPVPQQGETTP